MIKKVLIICSLCLLLGVGFTFMWQAVEDPRKTEEPDREAGKGYGSISEQKSDIDKTDDAEGEKYYLVLKDDTLCAYIIKGDVKTLMKSCEFSSNLIDTEEVRKLTAGIYASSYEEICLYMESYLS